jgi:hypothetical protein
MFDEPNELCALSPSSLCAATLNNAVLINHPMMMRTLLRNGMPLGCIYR